MAEAMSIEDSENFLEPPFVEDTEVNGFILDNYFLPEEVLTRILSYVPIDDILNMSLVCKAWCKIIRSEKMWGLICQRIYGQLPRKNPWFVLYAVLSDRFFFFDILSFSSRKEDRLPSQDASGLFDRPKPRKLNAFEIALEKKNKTFMDFDDIDFFNPNAKCTSYSRTHCACGCTEYYICMDLNTDKLVLYIRATFGI